MSTREADSTGESPASADALADAEDLKADSGGQDSRHLAEYAVAGFLFVYVLVRIVRLDLTNDEYGALMSVYREGFLSCLRFDNVDAQNHFLSSMVAIACLFLPFDEVISIRLPSLLGFGIYLYSTLQISRLAPSRDLGLLAFMAFSANAFLLDFFGLSRGYGLALGLLAFSLLNLLRWLRADGPGTGQRGWAFASALTAALAMLSNLAYLNYYLALCAVILFLAYGGMPAADSMSQRLRRLMHDHRYLIYISSLLFAFYVHRVALLLIFEQFYFGGEQGFVADTVASLVNRSLYGLTLPAHQLEILAWAISVSVAILAILAVRAGGRKGQMEVRVVVAVLALMVAYALALHYLLEIKFLVGRTALMFVPLAISLLLFAAMALPRVAQVVTVFFGLYTLLGFSQMNLTHTSKWRPNAEIRTLVRSLPSLRQPGKEGLTLGVSDEVKTTLWYYIEKELGLPVLERLKDNGFVRRFDWLAVYSLTYSLPPGEGYHHLFGTDFLYIAPGDEGNNFGQLLETEIEYPISKCRLEKVLGPDPAAAPPGPQG